MKKITAAFDGLKFSKATLKYAMELAVQNKALLTGVFLEDFLYHSFNLYDMIGSRGISSTKLKHLIEKDRATRQEAVELFKQTCEKKGIYHLVHQDESFAIDDLLKESIYSDLVLISAEETFNHFQRDKPTPFIKDLLASAQSPVLLLPSNYQPIDRVVLLYDGHPSSVFAFKMFSYLFPGAQQWQAELVYVNNRPLALLPDGNLIGELMRCHFNETITTQLTGDAEEALINHLKKLTPGSVVVMGAYSRGAVSRMFNSSMANKLMEVLDMPIFIAHNK